MTTTMILLTLIINIITIIMIRELAKTMAEFCFNVETNRPKGACASGCAVPLYVNVEITTFPV